MRLLGFAGLSLIIAVIASANWQRDIQLYPIQWSLLRESPMVVETDTPIPATIVQTVKAPGFLEPAREMLILPPKTGGTVMELPVRNNQRVKKGEVLLRLDDSSSKSGYEAADGYVESLKKSISRAREELERLNSMNGTTFGNTAEVASQLSRTRGDLERWTEELVRAEANTRAWKMMLDRCTIYAPMTGLVDGISIEVGDVIAGDSEFSVAPMKIGSRTQAVNGQPQLPQDPLLNLRQRPTSIMTIRDDDQMQAHVAISEGDISRVLVGQQASVYLASAVGHALKGTVDRIETRGVYDGQIVSFGVWIRLQELLPNARSGMRVSVEIESERRDPELTLPIQSVLHKRVAAKGKKLETSRRATTPGMDSTSSFANVVFVRLPDGVATMKQVEVGSLGAQRVEIISGLTAMDNVVVGPFRALEKLQEGDRLETSSSDSNSASAQKN